MKNTLTKNGLYVGIGAGLVLFAFGGLLPGSYIGGSIGVNIAKSLLGNALESSLLPRLIVGISMLSGIVVTGLFLVISTSSLGWLIGYFLGSIVETVRSSAVVKNEAAVDSN